MTTNPETAGVEPVAAMRERLRKIASLANAATTFHEEAMMQNYQTIVSLISPAAREDREAVQDAFLRLCEEIGIAATPLAYLEYRSLATTRPAPQQAPDHANCAVGEDAGSEVDWLRGDWYEKWEDATENADEELMATLEALRGRVEQTIRAALAAMPTPAAIRAETTAQIVAEERERCAKIADHELVEIFDDSPEEDTICNAVVREIAKNIRAGEGVSDGH